ncbi:MAG: sigma-54 dependent transcriptional regulator [Bacteroidota bacterium]
MAEKKILVIDDDMDMCSLLQRFLTKNGYTVETATSGHKGIEKFKEGNFPLVLCDYRLGDKEGRDVLKELKANSPATKVIIITGYSDIKTAVEVIKMGAFDYITKPLIPDEILSVLDKAMQQPASAPMATSSQPAASSAPGTGLRPSQYLTGSDIATKELYQQIQLVAPTNYSIILYGESGTGKEVIAKTIHENSNRASMPFVAVDCGTLTKELAGSELFGHEKGSFTGAVGSKEGFFEVANGGTLFLDEVANLGIGVQATLLRVMQERKFKRVGGNKEMPVDVRVIVASNENLNEAYIKGKFREDLFHRFNEFSIHIPPLRQRGTDITAFANYFLDITNEELGKTVADFSEEVMELFMQYPWPGNVRELRNVVRRAVLLTSGKVIDAKVLPPEIIHSSRIMQVNMNDRPAHVQKTFVADRDTDLKNAATQAEYETVMKVLQQVKYNKTKAAEILHIDRKTLYNKIKSFEEQMTEKSQ